MAKPLLSLARTGTLVLLAGIGSPINAHAGPAFCRAHQSDRTEQPAPKALLQRLAQTFGVAPDGLGAGYVRCDDGRLMGCIVGANLACGRADVSRRSAGGNSFCHDSPGADSIPLAATGHDTIYDWHCDGTHAVAGKALAAVDRFGFMSQNWRLLR